MYKSQELSELARLLKSLDGEARVVMESTGNYHATVAWLLHGAGLYAVSYTHLDVYKRQCRQAPRAYMRTSRATWSLRLRPVCRRLPVSYTHLDVYKRQQLQRAGYPSGGPRLHPSGAVRRTYETHLSDRAGPVSYTHLEGGGIDAVS